MSMKVRGYLGLLCLIVPLVFYFAIYIPKLHSFAVPATLSSEPYVFADDPDCSPDKGHPGLEATREQLPRTERKLRAVELNDRSKFAIASSFMELFSIIGVFYSLYIVFRSKVTKLFIFSAVAVLIIAIYSGYLLFRDSGMRILIANDIFTQAIAKGSITAGAIDLANSAVGSNLVFGSLCTVAVLLALAAASSHSEESPAAFRRRLLEIQLLSIPAALVLALTVVATKAHIGWATDLLCPDQASDLAAAGASLANYWGAGASGVLVAALLPAYALWIYDVRSFVRERMGASTFQEQSKFLDDERLQFLPTTALFSLGVALTPALTGPGMDIVRELLPRVVL
jgi:hypothetical protein